MEHGEGRPVAASITPDGASVRAVARREERERSEAGSSAFRIRVIFDQREIDDTLVHSRPNSHIPRGQNAAYDSPPNPPPSAANLSGEGGGCAGLRGGASKLRRQRNKNEYSSCPDFCDVGP